MSKFVISEKDLQEPVKHFIKNPYHPRLLDIAEAVKASPIGPNSWLFYMEDIEGEKDRWFEVLELNLLIDEHGFAGNEEDALHDICDAVFPETSSSSSGYFAESAYIAGARFRNGNYTVRLHRECGFKNQTHSDYLSYTWELQ